MPRTHRTSFYAALLLTPLVVSLGYLAVLSRPPPTVVVPALAQPCTEPVAPVVGEAVVAAIEPVVEPAVEPEAQPVIADTLADPGAAMLLVDGELVVPGAVDAAWYVGKPRVVAEGDGFTLRSKLAGERLPAELGAVVGGRYTLYAGDGSSCVVEASGLSAFARVDGVFQDWDSRPGRDELQRAVDEMDVDVPRVLARFSGPRGCTGVWARRSELPAPVVYARASEDAGLTAQVLAKVVGEQAVVDLQGAREEYLEGMESEQVELEGGGWGQFVAAHLRVNRWDELGGARSVVTVELGDDSGGCGGFQDEVTLIYALVDGALVLQEDAGFHHPLAVMDIDRDGHLEAVTAHGQRLETRGEGSLAREASFPDYGCPC